MRPELLLMLKVVLKSFMFGALGACAMGPVFLIILNRALDKGFWGGFASALGISSADGLFFALGLAGSLSVAARSVFILRSFEGFGGLMLIVFGLSTIFNLKKYFYNEPQCEVLLAKQNNSKPNFVWMSVSSFFINISNPMTLIFFATIASKAFPELAGLNFSWFNVLYAATACSCGSLFLFSLVSAFASLISKLFVKKVRIILESVSATCFLGIGLYLFSGFLKFIIKSRMLFSF